MQKGQTMNIKEVRDGSNFTLYLEGQLDTTTVKDLNAALDGRLDGVEYLVLDMEKLEYISSAGLRSLLINQKIMSKQGKMVIRNVNEIIMETFQLTGFHKVLTIE